MPLLEPIILIGGCLLSASLGALGSVIYFRAKIERVESESWRSARLFYLRANPRQHDTRL
jgi:hypothetical protein